MNRRAAQVVAIAVVAALVAALVRMLRGGPVPAFDSSPSGPVPWPPLPQSDEPAPQPTEPSPLRTGLEVPAEAEATPEAGDGDGLVVGAEVEPVAETLTGSASEAPWVLPAPDGTCPVGHMVKAKVKSGIYHVPGGGSYGRLRPDRCYRSPADAEADGLRPAKR